MAEIKVDRTTADRISAMIREGVRVDDIAEIENIPKRLVSVLEHSIALREGEGTKLERLMDLLKENTLESEQYRIKRLRRKAVGEVARPGWYAARTNSHQHRLVDTQMPTSLSTGSGGLRYGRGFHSDAADIHLAFGDVDLRFTLSLPSIAIGYAINSIAERCGCLVANCR